VEGVADRGAHANHVIGVKFVGVVEDAVIVRLGSYEEVPPYLEAIAVRTIEKHSLAAYAGHEIGSRSFGHMCGIQSVDVID
jgi:hypothetical protein